MSNRIENLLQGVEKPNLPEFTGAQVAKNLRSIESSKMWTLYNDQKAFTEQLAQLIEKEENLNHIRFNELAETIRSDMDSTDAEFQVFLSELKDYAFTESIDESESEREAQLDELRRKLDNK